MLTLTELTFIYHIFGGLHHYIGTLLQVTGNKELKTKSLQSRD